uniref:Uncharacterized protein n=1 Tax=Malurus cyaneus samueli TaxID=2593467 RepID=A0A8C5T612_9PASS
MALFLSPAPLPPHGLDTTCVPSLGTSHHNGHPNKPLPLKTPHPLWCIAPVAAHFRVSEDGSWLQESAGSAAALSGSWTFPRDVRCRMLPTELLCLLPGPRVPSVCLAASLSPLPTGCRDLFEAFDRCEHTSRYVPITCVPVAKLMLYLLLGIHWHACLYFALFSTPWGWALTPGSAQLSPNSCVATFSSSFTAGSLAVLGFATITATLAPFIRQSQRTDAAFYPDARPDSAVPRLSVRCWQDAAPGRKLRWSRRCCRYLPRGLRGVAAAACTCRLCGASGVPRCCGTGCCGSCACTCARRSSAWEFAVPARRRGSAELLYFIPEATCRGGRGRFTQLAAAGRGALLRGDQPHQTSRVSPALRPDCHPAVPFELRPPPHREHGGEPAVTANILSIVYSTYSALGKEDLEEVLPSSPVPRCWPWRPRVGSLLLRSWARLTPELRQRSGAEAEAEQRLQGWRWPWRGCRHGPARLLGTAGGSALRMALRIQAPRGRGCTCMPQRWDRAAGTSWTAGEASAQWPAGTPGPTQHTGFNHGASSPQGTGPSNAQGAPRHRVLHS